MSDSVIQSLIAKRGTRFAGDNKNIALYYERSKNANLVVFEIKTATSAEHGGKRLQPSDTIDAYWLDLEPSYQAKKRAKGITSDRDELNFVERWKGYGASAENVEALKADIKFVALPNKNMTLHLVKAQQGEQFPVVRCPISGKDDCIIEKIYVHSDEEAWIPTVVYIDIHGVDGKTGEAVTERIKP